MILRAGRRRLAELVGRKLDVRFEPVHPAGQIIEDPMVEATRNRSVRVVHYDGERGGAVGRATPGKRGGAVLATALAGHEDLGDGVTGDNIVASNVHPRRCLLYTSRCV